MTDKVEPLDLGWLVNSRSENQKTSLELYEFLLAHQDQIATNDDYAQIALALVGIAFSLWRAVFLGDKKTPQTPLTDAVVFLKKVIQDNAIGYQQDRNASDWTFDYYLHNARYRLYEIRSRWPEVLPHIKGKWRPTRAHWDYHHGIFAEAVGNFSRMVKQSEQAGAVVGKKEGT
jgi:hypothetical protein